MRMTQNGEQANKISELNAIFMSLNEKGQDEALSILRSLAFAQSCMGQSAHQNSTSGDQTA